MLDLDANSAVPIHAQIEQGIRLRIARGALRPGERLPTVRQLAADLRVNSNTVARVYQALERQGAVETKRGLGTFVAALPPPAGERAAVAERRLSAMCREFIAACSREGFTLREIRRAIAAIANGKDD